ncbi:hypothetical protein ACS0Y7_17810, partial [Burkholderia gladioli]|uniref:hypothetical protein n=1 Tax=Burkholderia gladioli TaxID=28095 RepID=UPI003F7957A0
KARSGTPERAFCYSEALPAFVLGSVPPGVSSSSRRHRAIRHCIGRALRYRDEDPGFSSTPCSIPPT